MSAILTELNNRQPDHREAQESVILRHPDVAKHHSGRQMADAASHSAVRPVPGSLVLSRKSSARELILMSTDFALRGTPKFILRGTSAIFQSSAHLDFEGIGTRHCASPSASTHRRSVQNLERQSCV
jgi:hypothetical protein